jgi:uncharacterized membrane protein YhaH (DUF805 family)
VYFSVIFVRVWISAYVMKWREWNKSGEISLLFFVGFMFLINSKKNCENASIFKEFFHVLHNTQYKIIPFRTNIFSVDYGFFFTSESYL